MDLARRHYRVCYGVAEYSMAGATSLAHVRTVEQHRPQQQKRRAQSHAIYRAANCVNESRDTSAVDRGTVVGVWFALWRALSGDRNHLSWLRLPSFSCCTAKVITSRLRIRCSLPPVAWRPSGFSWLALSGSNRFARRDPC